MLSGIRFYSDRPGKFIIIRKLSFYNDICIRTHIFVTLYLTVIIQDCNRTRYKNISFLQTSPGFTCGIPIRVMILTTVPFHGAVRSQLVRVFVKASVDCGILSFSLISIIRQVPSSFADTQTTPGKACRIFCISFWQSTFLFAIPQRISHSDNVSRRTGVV